MLRNFFTKWFNKNNSDFNQQKVPQGFKQKNRRIFLNRYAGIIYFLLAWHTFGYLIIKFANISAHKRGVNIHEDLSEGQNLTKLEFDKNFKLKITEIVKED